MQQDDRCLKALQPSLHSSHPMPARNANRSQVLTKKEGAFKGGTLYPA